MLYNFHIQLPAKYSSIIMHEENIIKNNILNNLMWLFMDGFLTIKIIKIIKFSL